MDASIGRFMGRLGQVDEAVKQNFRVWRCVVSFRDPRV